MTKVQLEEDVHMSCQVVQQLYMLGKTVVLKLKRASMPQLS